MTELRTSRDVYNRLRWDPSYDATRFVIAYSGREEGLVEVPLTAWDPKGPIPWHRVESIRMGQLVVWDRRRRIDRIFGSGATPPAEVLSGSADPEATLALARRMPWAWDPAARRWVEVERTPEAPPRTSLEIATWNVLYDREETDPEVARRRLGAISATLRESGADVLCLQETTPALVKGLLAEGWVRDGWFVSDGPSGRTVFPHGVLLLSRVPVRRLADSPPDPRRALVATLDLGEDRSVSVAVVHLPSDRKYDRAAERVERLESLLATLVPGGAGTADVVLAGDFNERPDDVPGPAAARDFADAWRSVRGAEDGPTFDPRANPLAARESRTGLPARFDRVLVRSPLGRLRMVAARRFGLAGDPVASDHFGLAVRLELLAPATRQEPEPTWDTAVVLVPPPPTWPAIDAIRTAHDPAADRWMPHVTLLRPFVPERNFEAAACDLERAFADLPPAGVRLERFDRFEHASNATVWLDPETTPPGALLAVRRRLEGAFPGCARASGSHDGFTPHLTVAALPGATAADRAIEDWSTSWSPVEFRATRVAFVARGADGRFAIRRTVRFGNRVRTHRLAEALPPAAPSPEAAVARLAPVCHGVLGLQVVGSHALRIALPDGDIDLVALLPAGADPLEFLRGVARELGDATWASRVRFAAEALVPRIQVEVDGRPIDLQAAADSSSPAIFEPDRIVDLIRPRTPPSTWRVLARAVRTWARAAEIDAQPLGYPGGVAWALLAAWIAARPETPADSPPEELLASFFETFATWPWPAPVALAPEAEGFAPRGPRDRMPVLSSVAPFANTARTVTRSTFAVVTEALASARDEVRRIRAERRSWHPLFRASPLPAGDVVRLGFEGGSEADRDEAAGRLEGQFLSLLLDLERDSGLLVRPRRRPGRAGLSLELHGDRSGVPAAIEALRARFQAPPGVRLTVET